MTSCLQSKHLGPFNPSSWKCECCGEPVLDISDPPYCRGDGPPTGCDPLTGFCGVHHTPIAHGKCTYNTLLGEWTRQFTSDLEPTP